MTATVQAPRPRCPACGEVLGVYEPLVLDTGDGRPVRTSLLRLSPDARAAATAAGDLYHASCHAPGAGASPSIQPTTSRRSSAQPHPSSSST
jgi:hypothetical protein